MIGKRPLAPTISPKKTKEGAAAGLLAAIGASLALGALLDLPAAAWQQALVGLVVGVVAQVGDLAESLLKRSAGAKEAGGLIPGHGGVLDRLDSLLFALPVVYYVVVLALGR
jgi:phosphatidate cytidylyltransferase